MSPTDALARADGVAQAPDGTLFITGQPEWESLARFLSQQKVKERR